MLGRMMILDYTRTTGRQRTYRIQADEQGGFVVHLGPKEMMRGRDRLTARGRRVVANKRKAVGAVEQAKQAIESLVEMDED